MSRAHLDDPFRLVMLDLHAQPAQDVAHELDVAEIRYATDNAGFAREQCGGDNW